jgi:hypothetical protein
VAVDDRGGVVTSTEPTEGQGAWSLADIDGTNHLFTVSCATAKFCAAGDDHGHVVTTNNPTGGATAWKTVTADAHHWVTALSCPSANLCAGGDSAYDTVVGSK